MRHKDVLEALAATEAALKDVALWDGFGNVVDDPSDKIERQPPRPMPKHIKPIYRSGKFETRDRPRAGYWRRRR